MAVKYVFPLITHIDEMLPHVDDGCFRVKEKDCGHTYINYVKMGNETFPAFVPQPRSDEPGYDEALLHNHRAKIRREARGIAFDTATGELVSRPFHKFFNVGEREDMDVSTIDWTAAHHVQDKVDGSMIRPIPTVDGLRWGTKMGITDTAMFAETWLMDHPKYEAFARQYLEMGWTPLFEYVSPENRVVVDYGGRNMTLLALRNNYTGFYMPRLLLEISAEEYDIPIVRVFDPVVGNPEHFLASVKDSDDLDEGVVIWWGSGAAKCKTEAYNTLHHVKEAGRTERTLIQAIWKGKIDDLLPMLPEDDRARVSKFVSLYWKSVSTLSDDIFALYNSARDAYSTKKEFAIETADSLTQLERGVVFGMWDGKYDATDAATNILKNGLSSETKWAETKQNIAMASNFNNLVAHWQGTEDIE